MKVSSADLLEQLALGQFTEQAYLNYSMYVILDRALPSLADGLKPVQRRIVYAMSELGLNAGAKPKKSARTVGDVLGKYHPHGDSACYEAMVLMAQPFSYRYPLVDGQGNWGSADDPKSFAAMRYTEARLSGYAQTLLSELEQGTVEWQANFDGTLQEPLLLPARLPNILLNGTSGIAVGMATDVPPHNIREVVSACLHLLEQPETDLDSVLTLIQGPDFPSGGELISSREELRKLYLSGTGSVRVRARYQVEDGEVIITELPYQVSGARILEAIAAQMNNKKLPLVEDLRDESDHENPVRLVIVPRSNRVDVVALMQHLFATTDLERSYRVNLNLIGLDGRPQVKPLLTLLREWLEYRRSTVRRRLQHRLQKIQARLPILAGLLIAYLHLDQVIEIIRSAEQPKAALMQQLGLSEAQAEAILELRLRQLAKLEEHKLRAEQAQLEQEQQQLLALLDSASALDQLIAQELRSDAAQFADARRTQVVEGQPVAQALSEVQLAPSEVITVVLSQKGWVRAAKGREIDVTALAYKSGDGYLASVSGRSQQSAVFFDDTGRAYALPAHTLASARGFGEPLSGRFTPPAGSQFVSVLLSNAEDYYVLASSAGYGFICRYEQLVGRNKAGKAVISLTDGAQLLKPLLTSAPIEQLQVLAISRSGKMLVFPLSQLPQLAKGKGNQLISLAKDTSDTLAHLVLLNDEQTVSLNCGKRSFTLKKSDLEAYTGERGKRGKELPRGLQKVDSINLM